MALDEKELSFNNSNVVVNTVDEDLIIDEVHGKHINNNFCYQIDAHRGTTGSVLEENGVIYVQKVPSLGVLLCTI